MTSIVVSIGGSVLLSDDATKRYLKDFVKLFSSLSKKHHIYLVVGGGKTARDYIQRGRILGLSEKDLDTLGILITRVNATMLTRLFSNSNKDIPCSVDDTILHDEPVVIMGGTVPGHSTDYVGAELAAKVNADEFIIATNVDGIFDKDPNKHSDAVMLPELDIEELLSTYGSSWDAAGSNVAIDGPALKKIADHHIQTVVLNGKNLSNLHRFLSKESFVGTTIKV
jgi:uridylate kinase